MSHELEAYKQAQFARKEIKDLAQRLAAIEGRIDEVQGEVAGTQAGLLQRIVDIEKITDRLAALGHRAPDGDSPAWKPDVIQSSSASASGRDGYETHGSPVPGAAPVVTAASLAPAIASGLLASEMRRRTPAAGADEGPVAFWWCDHCEEEVDASRVTYQEHHDACGHIVRWIEQAKRVDPPAREPSRLVVDTYDSTIAKPAPERCAKWDTCTGSKGRWCESATCFEPKPAPADSEDAEALHEGDPCKHCGVPHDDVPPGPCAGHLAERIWGLGYGAPAAPELRARAASVIESDRARVRAEERAKTIEECASTASYFTLSGTKRDEQHWPRPFDEWGDSQKTAGHFIAQEIAAAIRSLSSPSASEKGTKTK